MTLRHLLQAIRANIKLGWDQDGNWAPAVLYLLFALVAPIAGVLMLVFMYMVILGDSQDLRTLAFFLTGSAVFMYVRLALQGAGYAVVEDREHYRILRYMYIAPVPFIAQIFGRTMVKLLVGTFGVIATFLAARYILKIPFRPDGIDWGTFIGSLLVGLLGSMAIGWILASMMLLVDRMGWVWAEGVAGIMFLVSGAVIPLDVLPPVAAWVGAIIPVSYWAELWRHALYADGVMYSMPDISQAALWGRLWLTSVGWIVVAAYTYTLCDKLARKWGRIERETFY